VTGEKLTNGKSRRNRIRARRLTARQERKSSHINKPGVNLHLLLLFQVPDRNIGDQHVGLTVFKLARQFSVEQLELCAS
jgi:hypothetical protein